MLGLKIISIHTLYMGEHFLFGKWERFINNNNELSKKINLNKTTMSQQNNLLLIYKNHKSEH